MKHKGFAELDAGDREAVTMLGAILRLADGLDRSHTDAVRDLDAWLEDDQLTIEADCPLGCGAELWAGEKKGRFFGDLSGLRVRIHQRLGS